MTRLIPLALVIIIVTMHFGCSAAPPKSIAGRYVHIHGPLRDFLELKADKTASYYREEVGAPPDPTGFQFKPSTGNYVEENGVIKVHLEGGRLADVDGQLSRDWEFKKEPGTLVQEPEGTRFVLETDQSKAADVTTAKLVPDLPLDKAQLAIDEWVLLQLDTFQEMILHRPLKPSEKQNDRANTIARVLAGSSVIEIDGWRHVATVRISFNNIPVESSPPRPPGLSADQIIQFESRRNEMPKTVTLYSGPGIAIFWHDTDGKWFLESLGRIDPAEPLTGRGHEWYVQPSIQVK